MNELQLKLERRRKSIADLDSGARMDSAVSSQKASGAVTRDQPSSAAQKEMLAKLERRRRLNNEVPDLGSEDAMEGSVKVDQVAENVEVGISQSLAEPLNKSMGTEVDNCDSSATLGRPPVPPISRAQGGQRPTRVPPSIPNRAEGSGTNAADMEAADNHLLPPPCSPSQTESSPDLSDSMSSAAAALVLPWNTGAHSLRERKTPDKNEVVSSGLIEAHAKQHKRRKSIQKKLLNDFDSTAALEAADTNTLRTILSDLELELGPGMFGGICVYDSSLDEALLVGAFAIAVRKMCGQKAVRNLRASNVSDDILGQIILECASSMGLGEHNLCFLIQCSDITRFVIDAYSDVVEKFHVTKARDHASMESPRTSDVVSFGEVDPCWKPFTLMSCCHATGKWDVPAEAREILRAVSEKMGEHSSSLKIIGAFGAVRKGKSYFLNRVAGRQSGFAVGDDAVATCTEGIWAWCLPSSNVMLIDTAGM